MKSFNIKQTTKKTTLQLQHEINTRNPKVNGSETPAVHILTIGAHTRTHAHTHAHMRAPNSQEMSSTPPPAPRPLHNHTYRLFLQLIRNVISLIYGNPNILLPFSESDEGVYYIWIKCVWN